MATTASETKTIPRLEVLFGRCPVCSGTTNFLGGYMFCESCGQEWTIMGDPVEYKVEWRL